MRVLHLMPALVLLLLAAACGTEGRSRTTPTPADRGTPARMIELTHGTTTVRGTLEHTPAGRDFAALLPLTLSVSDFHGTEKISDIPRRLTTDGAPAGTTPTAGDISYFAPWDNLALFYGDYGYSDGLVRLGRLDPAGVELLETLDDGATITISPTT